MPIPAEQLEEKTDQSTDQEDTSVGEVFALGSSLEERVSRLEKLMLRHNHMKPDGTTRINGVWRRLKETKLNTASNSFRIDIPEGYRAYRLTILGGVSQDAYLTFQFNGNSSGYTYNVTTFRAGAFGGNSTSSGTGTESAARFAFWDGEESNMLRSAELTLYDPPTFINTYRTWVSRGHAQSLNGTQCESFIGSGNLPDTNSKIKYLTIGSTAGNINAETTFILEGLMK